MKYALKAYSICLAPDPATLTITGQRNRLGSSGELIPVLILDRQG